MASKYNIIALYGFLVLFGYLSYLILAPFFGYVILGLLFAFLFYPLYELLAKRLPSSLASALVIVIVLLCIIIPGIYFAGSLIAQATNAYQTVQAKGISLFDETSIANSIQGWAGVDVHNEVVDLFREGRSAIKSAIPGLITSTGAFLIGLFLMFFVLYYALKDGPRWFYKTIEALPIPKKHRKALHHKLQVETKALLYGQIVTSIFVGIINGIIFAFAGVPNPVFWAFLMIILGIIPVVGAFVVYVPAGIYLLLQSHWIAGIMVLVLCTSIHLVIDNIIRPKMVSKASEIHPVLVILGAIGGIVLMGVVGFLVGPLVLSFFTTLLSFDYGKPT